MKICVGILGESNGWKLLLEQEGVPHAVLNDVRSLESYSVLVVSDNVNASIVDELKKYVSNGGAVLSSGKIFSLLTDSPGKELFIKYISEEPSSSFAGIGLLDVESQCTIFAGAAILKTDIGANAVALTEYGKGWLIALPFDAGSVILDTRVKRKSFYAQRARLPFEQVSTVARGGIRKLVARSLEFLHHRRGLPYVHTWYYPADKQSIFSFRVDTDFASKEEIDALYALAKRYDIPFSWFIHVKAQEAFLQSYKKKEGHEIGVHCYDHVVYDAVEKNVDNISKAKHLLESTGYSPKGFAAPYGTWDAAMKQAIEKCNFEYSSEFSYDYDNLPSYPLREDGTRMTLQVPVHPISLGSLRRQSFSMEEMKGYVTDAFKRKLHHREPIAFYHHPKNAHHEALEVMFQLVRDQQLPVMTMIEVARWWKRRDRVRPVISYDGSTLDIASEHVDEEVCLHITRADGKESIVPMKKNIDLTTIQWKTSPTPLPLPKDIARSRKFNPYILINRMEDTIHAALFPKT